MSRNALLILCALCALSVPGIAAGPLVVVPSTAPVASVPAPLSATAVSTQTAAISASTTTAQSGTDVSTSPVSAIAPSTAAAYGITASTSAILSSSATAFGIVQSTSAVAVSSSTVKKAPPEPVALSGIVLTPTAYRGYGLNSLGLNLDINAIYYIGRLYGKNSYDWSVRRTNYIDRIGLWMLMLDGKMVVQTEEGKRPAIAAGMLGNFMVRDAAQPSLNGTQTVSANNSELLYGAYMVASKRFFNNHIIASAGYMDGTENELLSNLSEYLSADALSLDGRTGQSATSRSALFGGFLWLPKPDRPIGVEIIMPQGAPMNPKLINLHFGTLLHLNFELAYLTYDGGWDMLGMFQFRYNYFPRLGPSSTKRSSSN